MIHRPAVHAKQMRRLCLRQPFLHRLHDFAPQVFLRRGGKRSSIRLLHTSYDTTLVPKCHVYSALINKFLKAGAFVGGVSGLVNAVVDKKQPGNAEEKSSRETQAVSDKTGASIEQEPPRMTEKTFCSWAIEKEYRDGNFTINKIKCSNGKTTHVRKHDQGDKWEESAFVIGARFTAKHQLLNFICGCK